MNIEIRKVRYFVDVTVSQDSTTINLGLHNDREAMFLLSELEKAVQELKEFLGIEND